MLNPVFVDEAVAFSPMPERGEEMIISREFSLVVAVVESHELEYDPSMLRSRFIHLPVPDFRWPSLPGLAAVVREVVREAEAGGRVLIHCRGGMGRSATVAAAYLVARYGAPARTAVEAIRRLLPGAVEHPGQEGVLRALEAALSATGLDALAALEPEAGEEARVAGMAAEALHHAGVLGAHALSGLARAVLARGDWGPLTPLRGLLPEAEKLALIDAEAEPLEERGRLRLVIRSVLVSASLLAEKALRELAETLREKLRPLVAEAEAEEPMYY